MELETDAISSRSAGSAFPTHHGGGPRWPRNWVYAWVGVLLLWVPCCVLRKNFDGLSSTIREPENPLHVPTFPPEIWVLCNTARPDRLRAAAYLMEIVRGDKSAGGGGGGGGRGGGGGWAGRFDQPSSGERAKIAHQTPVVIILKKAANAIRVRVHISFPDPMPSLWIAP